MHLGWQMINGLIYTSEPCALILFGTRFFLIDNNCQYANAAADWRIMFRYGYTPINREFFLGACSLARHLGSLRA